MNLRHRVHAYLAPMLLAATVGVVLAGCAGDGTGGEPPTAKAQPGAAPVDQSVRPQPQTQPAAPSASSGQQGPTVVAEPGSGAQAQATEQQVDALRKRVEARRAKLRQQQQQPQQQPQPPAKNQ